MITPPVPATLEVYGPSFVGIYKEPPCLLKRGGPNRSDHLRVVQRVVDQLVQLLVVGFAAYSGFGDTGGTAYLAAQITDVLGKIPGSFLATVVGKTHQDGQLCETLRG